MPSGNRVEQLEKQVAELEATVEGLTEELVEANDRIRQIEAALGADVDLGVEGGSEDQPDGVEQEVTEDVESELVDSEIVDDPEPDAPADETAATLDAELAAAETDGGSAADTTKSNGDETGDEGDLDDIIVA